MKKVVHIIFFISTMNVHAQEIEGKFVPDGGKQLLVLGQDLGAIGGFPSPNNDGYYENVASNPGGVTFYTSLPSLAGLKKMTNWGGGDVCGQCIAENPKYRNAVISIGLYMVDQLSNINSGTLDDKIIELGQWIKSRNRPVFLRIGYEFDGAWNHYDPDKFVSAWRRIKDIFDSISVENCATVWQACTSPVDEIMDGKHEDISVWYPGDEYVDWMAYSWFLNDSTQYRLTNELLDFARQHAKPVMVAESAPQGYDLYNRRKKNIAKIYNGEPGTGSLKKKPEEIWEEWFVPYFEYIDKNSDVIKAVAYINCNWDAQPMWGAPYKQGYWGDTRVEANKFILSKWRSEIQKEKWLHASDTLFKSLGYTGKNQKDRGGYRR